MSLDVLYETFDTEASLVASAPSASSSVTLGGTRQPAPSSFHPSPIPLLYIVQHLLSLCIALASSANSKK
jgi:hypothetical protein